MTIDKSARGMLAEMRRDINLLARRLGKGTISGLGRGTSAQRDVQYPAPTTTAEQVYLANQQLQWFNTDLGWYESYYAPSGTTGLTVRGLLAGGPPAGWYPMGPGPRGRLKGTGAGKSGSGYFEYDLYQNFGSSLSTDGLDSSRNYAGFTRPVGSALSTDLWGYYNISAELYTPDGSGTGVVGLALYRPSASGNAWVLQQPVPLLPSNGQAIDWHVPNAIIRPGDRLYIASYNGSWTLGGGYTYMDLQYIAPPLAGI